MTSVGHGESGSKRNARAIGSLRALRLDSTNSDPHIDTFRSVTPCHGPKKDRIQTQHGSKGEAGEVSRS
jgi:hypothetical protein